MSMEFAILLLVVSLCLVLWFARGRVASRHDLPATDTVDRLEKPKHYHAQIGERAKGKATVAHRELKGHAHVIDGDTIVIRGTKIRLAGIDAPELDQPWGQKSKWEMVRICKGSVITAKLNGETSHDRLVGTCHLPTGEDIGAELIKRGLALDWPLFSQGKYRHLEPHGARQKLMAAKYIRQRQGQQ